MWVESVEGVVSCGVGSVERAVRANPVPAGIGRDSPAEG